MFDNIGTDLDEEANKRRAASLFLTTGSCTALLGLVIGFGAYTTAEAIFTPEPEAPVVLLDDEEAIPDDPLPPPPPPPLKGRADVEDPTETTPDDLVADPKELDKVVPDKIVDQPEPEGTEDGHENGHEDGVDGGTPGNPPCTPGVDCEPRGKGGPPVKIFHHRELQTKRRITPRYPESARAMGIDGERCFVKVFIDEKGTPYDAQVEGCDERFHASSREAILKWRWYSPRDGKRRVKAQTTIAITYKLDD